MGALNEITVFLLQTVLSLYLFLMVLRFVLQLVRADFYNPLCQFIVKATNPLVIPLRRVLPGFGGIDLSSLVLSLLLQALLIGVLLFFVKGGIGSLGALLLASVFSFIALLLNIIFFAIIAMIIISFVAPGSQHPAIYLLYQITEPVTAPFRKLLPSMGGLDFSPILVFVLIRILEILLANAALALGIQGMVLWLF